MTRRRPFRCDIPIRFGDIDQAGVAYFPTLFNHCHVAFEEFFSRALRIPYPRVLLQEHLGFPTVHIEADFNRALKFGDLLAMEVAILRIGRSSVTFRYRAYVRRTRTPAFEVRSTTVCIDIRTFRSVPVPPRYRKLFLGHVVTAPR